MAARDIAKGHTTMAEQKQNALGDYQPQGCDLQYWEIAKPVALEILTQDNKARPGQDKRSAASRRSALCLYLTWLAEHEPELLTSSPLDADEIRRYLATDGMQRRSSHRSRVAVKSILMSFAGARNSRTVERGGSVAPVSDVLFDAALIEAGLFRNPVTRSNARALLLLSRAAGLDGADLRWVTGNDVVQLPSAGTWVEIKNPKNPREVPVLARFADQLEDLALSRGKRPMLGQDASIPIDPSVPGHIAGMLSRALANSGKSGRIQVEGLRKAWIAEHIAANTPLLPLMKAAGFKSLRTIDDLVGDHAPVGSSNPIHTAYELGGISAKRDRA